MAYSPEPQPPLPDVTTYQYAPAPPQQEREPVPMVVYTLMGINILMFVLTGLLGGLVDTNTATLHRFGMLFAPDVWQGQWWRLLTAMFLHGGLMHIVFNMWALRNLGKELEYIYGPAAFLVLYLGAGWMGSLASLVFAHTIIGSVGASGAIFGLAGAWLAIAMHRRAYFQAFGSQVLIIVAINLWFGFSSLGGVIDNNGHLGGLVGGFLLGLLLPNKLPEFRAQWRWPAAIATALVFLAITPIAVHLSQQRLMAQYQRAMHNESNSS
ncbi:MAG: rhomboid family intramembrane serine protease [Abitibacteriaceae bacterium]|nr:rhomboid family intramembrane serine protease [Abditibacteriaceae bacterium]